MVRRTATACFLCLIAGSAAAQTPRLLLDVGGTMVFGGTLGGTDATYTAPDGSTFTLFSVKQSVSSGAGLVGHLLIRVKPRVALEIHTSWTRPELRATTSNDFENAEAVTATQTVSQFMTGGGALVWFRPRGKWQPFARMGVSWLRQLSSDQTLYEDGIDVDLGAGVKYSWKEIRGRLTPYGLRADVWMSARSGGMELAQKSRIIAPAFSVALMFKL